MNNQQNARETMNEHEHNTLLNEILKEWHQWSAAESVGRGFGNQSASCRLGPGSSSRWEIADMDAVDAAMDTIKQPHRTALAFQARNLVSRAQVWVSPRLPENWEERQIMLMEARNMFTKELLKRGVI